VLWLFGADHQVTEVGAMNIFFVLKKKDGSGTEVRTTGPRAMCCMTCACVALFVVFRRLRGTDGLSAFLAHWTLLDGIAGSDLAWCLPRCNLRVFV
jgi:hypothetical protein